MIIVPPPKGIDKTSAILKFVRIPEKSTAMEDSFGKLFISIPISVEVPPISTTSPLSIPDKNEAPRMLFVGPEDREKIGYFIASETEDIVPSF